MWLKAPEGKLCGREQAKAWALREVWHADDKGAYGMLPFIASKLRKTKDSLPQGDPPGTSALKEFFEKVDADPNWFPGKHSEAIRGPTRILRGVKVTALKNACKQHLSTCVSYVRAGKPNTIEPGSLQLDVCFFTRALLRKNLSETFYMY